MKIDRDREDLSRFLVHLTREYEDVEPLENLITILNEKTIYARNAHCLVKYLIDKMSFSEKLRKEFYTVCFTETPLTQIKQLVKEIEGRKIQLSPYGLVFWKDQLFDEGASPAIYVNAKGTSISTFLLDQFKSTFKGITTLRKLEKAEAQNCQNIVHYYALINVVKDQHDFMWEREWRFHGDFEYRYQDVVAIVARNPKEFKELCKEKSSTRLAKYLDRLPIISPDWTYEELIEELAIITWKK